MIVWGWRVLFLFLMCLSMRKVSPTTPDPSLLLQTLCPRGGEVIYLYGKFGSNASHKSRLFLLPPQE